ncbi:MAG: hypothetical protein H7A39_03605 [Chlamydiales bacterium]|nr:hypothetical protein [Chlamydiales bacterium]
MKIENFSFSKVFRILDRVNRLLVATVVLLGVFVFALPLLSSNDAQDYEVSPPSLPNDERQMDCSVIGTGPFALQEGENAFPLPGLKDELVFLGLSQRPDSEGALILGLNSSKTQVAIRDGQELFLDYLDGGVHFCQKEAPLKIVPFYDGVYLRCSVLLDLPEFSAAVEWKFKETKWLHPPQSPEIKEAIEALKFTQIFGPDQLLNLYGGESFAERKEKFRFCFGHDKLLIGVGDDLVWQDEKWKEASAVEDSSCCFLARVLSVNDERVQVELWSPGGLDAHVVTLNVTKEAPLQLKFDDIFTRIRKRTRTCVSCLVDQKSRLLRKGDWLEKRKTGWKTLRSIDELESCIQGLSEGELFVFDGVEKIGEQWMFLGHAFDQHHTHAVPVQLPLSAKAKSPPKERRSMYDFDDDDDFFDDDDDFLNTLIPGGDDDD